VSNLKFIDEGIPAGQKTRRYSVYSNLSQALQSLGQVKFYGAWRKFCFFPSQSTLFDTTCLNEIAEFCKHQNDLRRQED
jgi:hypothetical protein